ncbi:hypothetical protein DFH07DRAFT_824360 [Mycena maculata]|uniref:Uncharacterized protein n=1 Tax=Mycena maculata TaxID=230809 RepID=A0AAD7NBJ8_9AGAR|nr:hypothetical protein DFH07DRAFT_824360 [Mycena maculata]
MPIVWLRASKNSSWRHCGSTVNSEHRFVEDSLSLWGEDAWDSLEDLCANCMKRSKVMHQQARQEFWDQLPQMYGLAGWDDLEKMKAAALVSP